MTSLPSTAPRIGYRVVFRTRRKAVGRAADMPLFNEKMRRSSPHHVLSSRSFAASDRGRGTDGPLCTQCAGCVLCFVLFFGCPTNHIIAAGHPGHPCSSAHNRNDNNIRFRKMRPQRVAFERKAVFCSTLSMIQRQIQLREAK